MCHFFQNSIIDLDLYGELKLIGILKSIILPIPTAMSQ